MAKLMQDKNGKLWQQVPDGSWHQLQGEAELGARAGKDLGAGEALLVGAGREFERLGRGAQNLWASAIGDTELGRSLAESEQESNQMMAGTSAAGSGGVRAALMAGSMLPALSTVPLGLGIGGARMLGMKALAEQTAIGAGMSGLGYSEDQGTDAMVGSLLSAGGFGLGQAGGRVAAMIANKGAATRAAVKASQEAAGAMPPVGAMADAIPPGAPGAVHFGQATTAAADDVLAGGLPGAAPGAAQLTSEQARLLPRAKELGLTLTRGQRTGSDVLMKAEASMNSSPFTAGLDEARQKANNLALNRNAAAAIGEAADSLGPDVLGSAAQRLSNTFEDVAGSIGRIGDDSASAGSRAMTELIEDSSKGAAITPEIGATAKRVRSILDSGDVTGERLMAMRSNLVQKSRDYAVQGKGLESQGLYKVVDEIDDVIGRELQAAKGVGGGSEVVKGWREAQAQWRMLRALETGRAVDAMGNVKSATLYTNLKREFPGEFGRNMAKSPYMATEAGKKGRDLMDTVRVAQAFRNTVNDSGTATRMSLQGLMSRPLATMAEGAAMLGAGKIYNSPLADLGAQFAVTPSLGGGTIGSNILRAPGIAAMNPGIMGVP